MTRGSAQEVEEFVADHVILHGSIMWSISGWSPDVRISAQARSFASVKRSKSSVGNATNMLPFVATSSTMVTRFGAAD